MSHNATKDFVTGETLKDNPTNTYDFGIKYDDKKSLRALIKGRYTGGMQVEA